MALLTRRIRTNAFCPNRRCLPGPRLGRLLAGILILLALGSQPGRPGPAAAQPPPSREYQIKAAFLYNFAKFVDWPPEAFRDDGSPFVIGILGVDPFGEALDSLKDKPVRNRRLVIRRLARVEEAEGCHILYVSSSARQYLRPVFDALRSSPVLTVSELDGFAQQGGLIGFVTVENKVQFDINHSAADRHRLKISSQLLKLARTVLP
jgi:hypothetical protein